MTAQAITKESIANGDFVRQTLNQTTMAPTQRGGVSARFYHAEVVNPTRTKAAGGAKQYDSEIHVEVRFAGDNSMGPTRRITTVTGEIVGQEYINMYPLQWEAFQKGEEVAVHGTPIETWPLCDRAMALSLKSLNVRTVEDLATISDGVLDKMGMGARTLRSKAQVFLESAKGIAVEMRLVQERDEAIAREKATAARFAAIEAQLASMKDAPHVGPGVVASPIPAAEPVPVVPTGAKAVDDTALQAMLDAASGPPKRGPGRPPNAR